MTGSMAARLHICRFDPRRAAALLAGGEDFELLFGRRVVAAISNSGEDALEDVADERFDRQMTWPTCARRNDCRAALRCG